MCYCDYSTYLELGGTMQESAFAVWGVRASRKIDRLTRGRASRFAAKLSAELADACAQIADLMYTQSNSTAASAGLSSVTNDGVSESYAGLAETAQALEQMCYVILADALGADPYGLLYAGVYRC